MCRNCITDTYQSTINDQDNNATGAINLHQHWLVCVLMYGRSLRKSKDASRHDIDCYFKKKNQVSHEVILSLAWPLAA